MMKSFSMTWWLTRWTRWTISDDHYCKDRSKKDIRGSRCSTTKQPENDQRTREGFISSLEVSIICSSSFLLFLCFDCVFGSWIENSFYPWPTMALFTRYAVKKLLHPYYITNIILSTAWVFLRLTPPFCSYLFPSADHPPCDLEYVSWSTHFRLFVSITSFVF